MSRRLVLPAVMLGVLLATAAPVHAHAMLVGSSPDDGATLTAAPAEIVLDFSDEMTAPASVVVTAPSGATLAAEEPEVAGTRVVQALEPTDEAGTYTYAFRVYSVDGHPVTGQQTFVVGAPSATGGPPEPDATDEAPRQGLGDDAAAGDPGEGWDSGDTQVAGAIALFGAAAVLYLLSRRPARRPGR